MSYELHPLCTLFPRVAGAEFEALVSDIKAHGLRQPIVLHDGMILDGGNRYRACVEAGVEPVFTEFDGGNLVSFVLSANLHRRHMTAPQQAAIVASAQNWAQAQTVGRPEKCAPGSTFLDTTEKRAAQSGASVATQRRADAVAKADPELAAKVAHGAVSLPQAVEQVAPQLASRSKSARLQKAGERALKEQHAAPLDEADEGPTLAELVDELQAENTRLTAEITALTEADDQKAETVKWHRMYEHAMRQQADAMRSAASHQKDAKRLANQVRECCRALGLNDPRQLVPTVKKLAARREAA